MSTSANPTKQLSPVPSLRTSCLKTRISTWRYFHDPLSISDVGVSSLVVIVTVRICY